jgi:hypothetical protein
MKTKQSFSNSFLQKINLEAEDIISNHLQELDRISNDIKALEERLKHAGVPFVFYYFLSSEDRRYNGVAFNLTAFNQQIPYPAEFVEQTNSCLVWGKCEDDNYRLSHNVYINVNEIDKHDDGNGQHAEKIRNTGENKLTSSKPLIETKSHFRVKIEKELVPFYKAIIEALKTKRDQDCVLEYSPNYNLPFPSAKIDTRFSF